MLIMELKAKFLLINSNSSISENEILFEEYLRKIESKYFMSTVCSCIKYVSKILIAKQATIYT